jgi:23S rRNA (uracil1939-C5)-methyltransferase
MRGLFGGEEGEVEIVHRSRQRPVDVGRLVRLTGRDEARRDPPCPSHVAVEGGRCTGCALMELSEGAQRGQKQQMLAALGLECEVVGLGPALGYRCSSKRVAFHDDGGLELGSWVRGSHEGARMTRCLVDHPLIARAADEIAHEGRALGLVPHDEATGAGDLRYVWLKTDGARVVSTLIAASATSRARALAPRLKASDAVAFSVQASGGNAIRGEAPEVLKGEPSLTVTIAGLEVSSGPLGFLQPNPEAIAAVYRALVADEGGAPLGGERAFDLYAGVGVTTALLRERFTTVEPCESYPESAAALGVPPTRVEDFLGARGHQAPDLVVANPPRRGLGDAVSDALVSLGASRLHVMSCGPEGLRRDLDRLIAGGYALRSLVAFDTLPQTPHVELVAKLIRGS